MDSPSDCMLIKFQLPSITFTFINSRETATNTMMNPRRHRGPYRTNYGSSDRSYNGRYHGGRNNNNRGSSKVSSYQQQSGLPPIESTINPHSYRSPYKSSRASTASSQRSYYYHSGLGPQSVR